MGLVSSKFKCDRCAREFELARDEGVPLVLSTQTRTPSYFTRILELCADCAGAFEQWRRQGK